MRVFPYLLYLKDLYTWVTDIFFWSNIVLGDAFKMLFKKKVLGMILKKCFKNKQNGKEANFRLTSYFVEGYLCPGNQIVLHFSCHIYEGKWPKNEWHIKSVLHTHRHTLSHIHTLTSSPTAVTPVALCVQHNDLYSQLKSYKGKQTWVLYETYLELCLPFYLEGRER